MTLELGATAEGVVPDTTLVGAKITYTFDGEPTSPYISKVGDNLVAGDQNAIVTVTLTAEETEYYRPLEVSAEIVIGDVTAVVNLVEHLAYINKDNPQEEDAIRPVFATENALRAQISGNTLSFTTERAGTVKLEVYDAIGNRVLSQSGRYSTGTHSVQLKGLSNGSYVAIVRQGSQATKLRWNKR